MASSIRKAQSPLSCQLCDSPVVLRWKCVECDVLMCDRCQIIHTRIKTTDTHSIISIKDVAKKESDKTDDDVSKMFASLEIAQNLEVSTKVISSVYNTYTTDLPAIYWITCYDDDKVYFYDYDAKKLVKAKLLKNSMKILNRRDVQVHDITINSKNELLMSPYPYSSLVAVSEDGEEKTVYNSSPLLIISYYFDKLSGRLLVGVVDNCKGPTFEITKSSTRQVLVLENYRLKRTIEFSGDGKRLFTVPRRITTDSDGNVYVLDVINEDCHGRVVAVDRDGKLKFTYSGYNNQKPFTPCGITVTPSNNIVVADDDNHSLHVLRQDGQLLAKHDTRDLDVIGPYSLCMDSEGFLVIGCNTYEGESDKAKIHVVKVLF